MYLEKEMLKIREEKKLINDALVAISKWLKKENINWWEKTIYIYNQHRHTHIIKRFKKIQLQEQCKIDNKYYSFKLLDRKHFESSKKVEKREKIWERGWKGKKGEQDKKKEKKKNREGKEK